MQDGFEKFGQEYRERNGLGGAFSKDVRATFLKFLARAYWEPTRTFMTDRGWPVAKACKAAGVDPSTPTRWDEMIPNYATICTLFAMCDLDMKGVSFPTGLAAFRSARFKTVAYIRLQCPDSSPGDLNKSPSAPDEEAWECLWLVLRSQAILDAITDDVVPPENVNAVKDSMHQAIEDIVKELGTRFPNGRINDVAGVQRTIYEWLIPVVLFYAVIPPSQGRGSP